jgi:hypothetical protein
VDELDLTVVLVVPSSARSALQATDDHVDRPFVLLERAIGVACLQRERQVALITTVFQLLVVTSPVIMAIIVLAATSIVTTVVVLAT